MARMPAAEVDVTPELARTLLSEQHPDLANLPISVFANGWDNAMLRLGDDLVMRVPRRALAATLVEHEQAWLPRLADRLPAPIPTPVRTGQPTATYPWSWSVLAWLPGRPLAAAPLPDRGRAAVELSTFLAALHTPAPPDVTRSSYRGGSLADRADMVADRVHRHLGDHAGPVLARWRSIVAAPWPDGAGLWVHGDVHPLNVLVEDIALAAVIDWGDICSGDPACDLAIAWLGFDAADAERFHAAYAAARTHALHLDALWERAWAWSVHLTTMILDSSDDHPELAAVGEHGRARLTGA